VTQKCFKKYTLVTFKDECKNIILYIFRILNLKAKELFYFYNRKAIHTGSDEWITN